MTRSPDPDRSPSPLAGVLVTGALLALGVLGVALRVPAADALLSGFSAADWHPPAGYPPFAAILFTPAAWLPAGVLKAVLVLGNGGLLALLVLLSCRLAGARARPGPVLAATIAGLWLEPLFQSPLPGQINLALACLALWDLGRPRAALGKGFALGTAAGITLTPAVFVPYLLLTGRARAGLTALAGLAGTALLGALVLPEASADFWAHHPPTADGAPLLHWRHLWVWAVPPLTALAAGTATALRRHRHRAAAARIPAPRSPLGREAAADTARVSRPRAARRRP
ncbi:alpha-1,2-mannosyltransferase [Streptomyces sp. 3211.6]|uniref:glycosyltransferase 87 family protein n=1 Tax=Streptomyces TaxID=1883 RepID=UPI000CA90177|nr:MULTISPECIES: glycosyltransferase 87 family protein [unclassified Streptomyces]RKT06066.1 alpha-1,2-mannosyltransferase [Streptomyces sp. 3211.6]RPF46394.1 alpha-1,2-mannosyltransferase [Streptomyces sp. Ag109_G2-6]